MMVSEPTSNQPGPPSLKLIKMHLTFDLSEIEEMTLQGIAGENLSALLTVYRFYKYPLESG